MQPHETFEPILVGVDEACAKLRIGRSTLYQLVKAKKLDIKKLGPKCTRVTIESINRYVAGLSSTTGDSPIKRRISDLRKLRLANEPNAV
jgi:excisionase family DNA binding protein